jgi:hypothetical protein
MFKLKARRRMQAEPLVFGVAFSSSLDDGPFYAERMSWRIMLALGWWHLGLTVYRVSEEKWARLLKAAGITP